LGAGTASLQPNHDAGNAGNSDEPASRQELSVNPVQGDKDLRKKDIAAPGGKML
jgi:hypothetical protein